jgi:hypothetical protein
MGREGLMEARDDLETLLLNGLPPEERKHVVDKIAEVNDAKRRYLQSKTEPEDAVESDLDLDTATEFV